MNLKIFLSKLVPVLAEEFVGIDKKSRRQRETGSVNKQSMIIRGTYGK